MNTYMNIHVFTIKWYLNREWSPNTIIEVIFNPFIPEFLEWTVLSLNFDMSTDACQSKIKNIMANSVDPDEMAHYEPSHLELHCLQRYLLWSARLKGFKTSSAVYRL